MAGLLDFKRSQIVGARMAGDSVTKTSEISSEARSSFSKVMTVFEKERKKITEAKLWGKAKAV